MTETEQRPRFYEGQYLGAADLTAAVDYSRSQLSRAMLAAHRWGIALGLDLVEVNGPNSTTNEYINPGYAWDGFGRPLLVSTPYALSPALFAQFDAAYTGGPNPPPVPVQVWLAYDETLTQPPPPGFQTCDDTSAYARVLESFRVVVGPKASLASQRDPIDIAGRTMDAAEALSNFDSTAQPVVDADVPQQALPADVTDQWLVPLGFVLWQPGNPGSFAKRDAATVQRSARARQYCGAVAGSIEANGGHVTVHDRTASYSTDVTDELLWVEGSVRADGDVHLYGSALGFIGSHAESPIRPFEVSRSDDPAAGTSALRLVIGEKTDGTDRLAVGPETAPGTYVEQFVVTDDGRVGVTTSDPHAPLHLPADGLQIGTSGTATDNFYVQANTDGGVTGLRAYNGDAKAGGTHVATVTADGKLGIGTTAPSAPVHVTGVVGIRQGALYMTGNASWSSLSFNAHHKPDNSDWLWDDPSKPAVTLEMDDSGGAPRFEVWSTPQGNNQVWVQRLRVAGHTGDVLLGLSGGGNLGVGVATPAARVDVSGDIQASGLLRTQGQIAVSAPMTAGVVAGLIDQSGVVVQGFGFTLAKVSTGRWQVTFTPPFLTVPTVIVTPIFNSWNVNAGTSITPGRTALVDNVDGAGAFIVTADEANALADSGFSFIAIGGR
jgi:hypothetical protein